MRPFRPTSSRWRPPRSRRSNCSRPARIVMVIRPKTSASDLLFRGGTGLFASLLVAMVVGIGILLFRESTLSIHAFGLKFWRTENWDPVAGDFGALPFIWGT